MEKKNLIIGIILIILLIVFGTLHLTKDYGQRTGTVTGWNYIQLGYNIFFDDDQTLFLHGGDWKLTEFLENQTYPKRMTFIYHMQTTGCDTNCGCRTWKHIMEIRDDIGTKIFERELWQEW
jgi:hypothetical protein